MRTRFGRDAALATLVAGGLVFAPHAFAAQGGYGQQGEQGSMGDEQGRMGGMDEEQGGPEENMQLDPSQVAQVLTTLNEGINQLAEVAQDKSSDKSVQSYVTNMVKDLEKFNTQLTSFYQTSQIRPSDSQLSDRLHSNINRLSTALDNVDPERFDQFFTSSMVATLSWTLAVIDGWVVPSIDNQRSFMSQVQDYRSMIDKHLSHGRDIQEQMASETKGSKKSGKERQKSK